MFKLNEAPNAVLAAMSSNQINRECGTFWSILCFLPSCGLSIADDKSNDSWTCCCYPKAVSVESDVTLNVLMTKLNELRTSKDQISKDTQMDERKVIEWQVKETLALLKKATSGTHIQGSYRDSLNKVYKEILTQATQEEQFGQTLDIEQSPLKNLQPYTANYGLTTSMKR